MQQLVDATDANFGIQSIKCKTFVWSSYDHGHPTKKT
jgi:hypothetical protein